MQDRYQWRAYDNDEPVEQLTTCDRFVLSSSELPCHEIRHVPMIRRFGRGFIRGGGGIREYLQCVVLRGARVYVRSSDGGVIITPEKYELYL